MPSSRASSQPRDQTQVFRIAGSFFTCWATREAISLPYSWSASFLNKVLLASTLHLQLTGRQRELGLHISFTSSFLSQDFTGSCPRWRLWLYFLLLLPFNDCTIVYWSPHCSSQISSMFLSHGLGICMFLCLECISPYAVFLFPHS